MKTIIQPGVYGFRPSSVQLVQFTVNALTNCPTMKIKSIIFDNNDAFVDNLFIATREKEVLETCMKYACVLSFFHEGIISIFEQS